MAYNVNQALRDGLSEEEIAKHLATTRNYRFDDAIKAGYSHKEIIDHLAPQKPIGQKPTTPPPPSLDVAPPPPEPVVQKPTPLPPEPNAPTEAPTTGVYPDYVGELFGRKPIPDVEPIKQDVTPLVAPPEKTPQPPALGGILPPGFGGMDVMRHRPVARPVQPSADLTQMRQEPPPSNVPIERPSLPPAEPFAQEGEPTVVPEPERARQLALAEEAKATAPVISTLKDQAALERPRGWTELSLPETLGRLGVGSPFGVKPTPKKPLSPEELGVRGARDTNILAISKNTDLSPSFIEQNYDAITKELGVRNIQTTGELLGSLMTAAIGVGLIATPIPTMTGIATVMGIKEAESLATQFLMGEKPKLLAGRELKEYLGPLEEHDQTTVDALEFVLPGLLGAKVMSTTKHKLSGVLSRKIIHEAWERALKTEYGKKLLDYKGTYKWEPGAEGAPPEIKVIDPAGFIKRPDTPVGPKPTVAEVVGSDIPSPGGRPVASKPIPSSGYPQLESRPFMPPSMQGTSLQSGYPQLEPRPSQVAKAQPEVVGTTIPGGGVPVTSVTPQPKPPIVTPQTIPTEVVSPPVAPPQPIPQMMGIGQDMEIPKPKMIWEEVPIDDESLSLQVPPTAQHLEEMPEEYPDIKAAALEQDGKVYTDHTHVGILVENNLDPEKVTPGFVTTDGKFIEQYPDDNRGLPSALTEPLPTEEVSKEAMPVEEAPTEQVYPPPETITAPPEALLLPEEKVLPEPLPVAETGVEKPLVRAIPDLKSPEATLGGKQITFKENKEGGGKIISVDGKDVGTVMLGEKSADRMKLEWIMLDKDQRGQKTGINVLNKIFSDNPDINFIEGGAMPGDIGYWKKIGAHTDGESFAITRQQVSNALEAPDLELDKEVAQGGKPKNIDEAVGKEMEVFATNDFLSSIREEIAQGKRNEAIGRWRSSFTNHAEMIASNDIVRNDYQKLGELVDSGKLTIERAIQMVDDAVNAGLVDAKNGEYIKKNIAPLAGEAVETPKPVGGKIPIDADENELVDMDGVPMDVNPDGTITIYHRTSPEKAEQVRKTGKFLSLENTDETFFSNKLEGQAEGYGDAVVAVKVKPSDVRLNDAFHNGEIHVAVSNKRLSKKNILPNLTPPAGEARVSTEVPAKPSPEPQKGEVVPLPPTLPPGHQVVPAVSKKTKKVTVNDKAKEFYQPGNIVYSGYWKTYDKVLQIKGTPGEPNWKVEVQQVDKDGNPTPGVKPRWHSTLPSKGDRVEKVFETKPIVTPPGHTQVEQPEKTVDVQIPGFKAEEPKPEPKKIEPVVEEVPAIAEGESKPLKWADLPEGVQKNIPKELTDLRTEPYFGTQIIKGEKKQTYGEAMGTHTYDAKTGEELYQYDLNRIEEKVAAEKRYEADKAKIAGLPDVEGKKVEPAKTVEVKTQKDQKKYLIDAIDEAIKQAPDKEIKPALLKIPDTDKPIMEKTPHVIIEVPGDGIFRVINSKQALQGFKKVAEERFPGTKADILPPSLKKPSMPSEKPTGRRISPKQGSAYEYITEYSPKRVSEADYATDQSALVGEGWFSNGQYMVKGEPPTGYGKKATNKKMTELTKKHIKQVTPSLKGMSPATHVAEFHVMDSSINSGLAVNDKGFSYFNPALMDVVRKYYPDSTLYIADEQTPMAFVKDKKVVAVLMPMRGGPTGELIDKYFADQGIKVPWEKEVVKEEVKTEAPTKTKEPWETALERLSNLKHTEISDSAYHGSSKEIARVLVDSGIPLDKIAEHLNTLEVARKEHAINPKLVKTDYTVNDIENFIKEYQKTPDYDALFKRFKNQTSNQAIDYFEVEGHKIFKVEEVELPKGLGGTGLGFTNDAEGNIYLRKDLSRQGFEKALDHELRHHKEKGWEETVNLADMIEAPETKVGVPEKSYTLDNPPKLNEKVIWRDREGVVDSAPSYAQGTIRILDPIQGRTTVNISDLRPASSETKPISEPSPESIEGKKPWGMTADEYVVQKNIPESAEIFYKTAQSRKALKEHEQTVKQALLSGDLTPAEYSRLHEKDYGKLEEFTPGFEKQVEEAPKKINAKTLTEEIKSEPDYVYHATNEERLSEIADTGKLRTHKPGEFTDQNVWPDGSTKKRAYFSDKADIVWQFAPEEGRPVVIRTKGKGLLKESTGDVYSNKPISVDTLEYLGEDDNWHPVSGLKTSLSQVVEEFAPELQSIAKGEGEKKKDGSRPSYLPPGFGG